jgi:hypothetical protein
MMLAWYLDRGSALTAYAVLWLATLTGILYNAHAFARVRDKAFAWHVPVSVVGLSALLLHVSVGTLDSWYVLSKQVPQPGYSYAYFVVGDLVGASALLLLVVAVLAFVDPKRFERPWDPKVVHAFAYGGFVFSTIHAFAIGTDFAGLPRSVVLLSVATLLAALLVRYAPTFKAATRAPPADDRRRAADVREVGRGHQSER